MACELYAPGTGPYKHWLPNSPTGASPPAGRAADPGRPSAGKASVKSSPARLRRHHRMTHSTPAPTSHSSPQHFSSRCRICWPLEASAAAAKVHTRTTSGVSCTAQSADGGWPFRTLEGSSPTFVASTRRPIRPALPRTVRRRRPARNLNHDPLRPHSISGFLAADARTGDGHRSRLPTTTRQQPTATAHHRKTAAAETPRRLLQLSHSTSPPLKPNKPASAAPSPPQQTTSPASTPTRANGSKSSPSPDKSPPSAPPPTAKPTNPPADCLTPPSSQTITIKAAKTPPQPAGRPSTNFYRAPSSNTKT